MSRRALVIGLVISVALNLFLVGAIAGAMARRSPGPMGAPGHHLRPMGPLWAAADGLSPQQRQAFHAALRGEVVGVGGKLREAHQARRRVWLSLGDEKFDAEAVTAALDEARRLEFAARGDVEHRIIAFAATLSPHERAKLADGLARAGPGRGPRPGPPDAPPGPPPP